MNFKDLKLDGQLLEAMSYLGFETPTKVQQKVIPLIFANKDLIACAQTGTGKTAAFVLPVLNKLTGKKGKHTDTLIIVPTRELAIQIDQQIQGLAYFVPASSIAVYGGSTGKDWELQKNAFKQGVDIIVATPGKLLSHLSMGYVDFKGLNHLVLDEADRMLDMGFIDDIQKIISYLPKKRQTMMFSATMAPNIRKLAKNVLHNPEEINISLAKPAEGIDQHICLVYENQKIKAIRQLMDQRRDYNSILIFTSTKNKVSDIVNALNKTGFSSEGISSNLDQSSREDVLRRFSAKQLHTLVATDVVSRGIDVKDINMVINYDMPNDAEDYVHRIGRTARVDAKGEAVTFVTPAEIYKLNQIEKLIEKPIPKLSLSDTIGPVPQWKNNQEKPGKNSPPRNKRRFKKR
ncbi:MAG: DEAD/DEAH box helicase [Bacteroidales bacterium]